MLHTAPNIPAHAVYKSLVIVVVLFATSCSSSTAPTSDLALPEDTSEPSANQNTDSLVLLPQLSAGQHLRFDNISPEQGLSQSTVSAITQDSQGFMWFGTEGGLNKYDGYQFTVYEHDPDNPHSLSDGLVTAIYEDRDGTLWIGTISGLDRLDRRTSSFTHYFQTLAGLDGFSRLSVSVILQDHTETLWVGTYGEGLIALDLKTDQYIVYQHNPDDPKSLSHNTIHTVYEDQDKVLWIGTDLGLDQFEPKSETFVHGLQDSAGLRTIKNVPVYAFNEDAQGALWVGSQDGLYQWNRTQNQLVEHRHDPNLPDSIGNDSIRCIFRDSQGLLWIGTRSGLDQFDQTLKSFAHYMHNPNDPQSLISNSIRSIYEDRSGVIWIGTSSGGLSKYARTTQKFPLYRSNPSLPNSLSENNIWAIFEDHNKALWVGTFSEGLNRLDRYSNVIATYQNTPEESTSLSNNDVRAILEDRNGNLWIGTEYGGLNRFDPQTETFFHYQHNDADPDSLSSDRVFVIYEDHLGRLWVGTQGGGLNLLDQDTGGFTHYQHDENDPFSLSDNDIKAIYEDHEDVLWIGTLGGLNLFRGNMDHFSTYHHDPGNPLSLSSDFVASIFEDSEESIWIGTFGGGLNRFDRITETFTHYTKKNGLPDNTIYGILEGSDGTLWLSTNNGLSNFDPHQETFRNYDVNDGLQGNQFNPGAFPQNSTGRIFFGGTQGFNAFFPEQVTTNPIPPPVIITSFEVFNHPIQTDLNSDETLQLSYRDSFISFEFAALDFNSPDKNQYAYKLDGVDQDWVMAGTRRYVSYSNLSGGEYVFHVIGSNNDGVWNEVGTSVKITIAPPFWETWWFQVVAILVLLGVVYGSYRLRVRTIEARSRELERQIEERTVELRREIDQRTKVEEVLRESEKEKAIAAERRRLARDLHDSVTQSLYSLTLFAEAARQMAEDTGYEPIETHIGRIGRIAQQALREMRLLVYELRPPILEKEGLIRALRQRLEAVEGRSGVEGHLVVDELTRLPGSVEQDLYHIALEALNNALKHALASSVVVYLREKEGRVELEIVDNGVGFKSEAVREQGGMGLENIRQRAEQVGGAAMIRSTLGEGTSVKVAVDLDKKPDEPGPSGKAGGDAHE